MACNVEVKYNPFMPQLQILIDGSQPPDFSRLIQYFDEDIWEWASELIESIYNEVRDDFTITFFGTNKDADIMSFICKKNDKCIGFNHILFPIDMPLTKRMGKLNQLIKKAGIIAYDRVIIDSTFLIPPNMQQYLEEIMSIDINNLFCAVRVSTIGIKQQYVDSNNSILFVLAESLENGVSYITNFALSKPAFVLIIGNQNRILTLEKKQWCIETTQENLINTIFDLFIEMPLLKAFRSCAYSIHGGRKISKEIKAILSTEPIIEISIEKEVEVGRSIRIAVSQKPDVGHIPKLIYKIRNQQIASCDGLSVYGLSEGDCILEVYKSGSKQPFFEKNIHVFQRNRIKKLVFSDDTVLMGISDKKRIILDYYPADADNVKDISWKSSDDSIVKVDNNGNVEAISSGIARIICTAENVSVQCICTVKPYLKDIALDIIFDEKDSLVMAPFVEMPINYECIPNDSVDADISIVSSDNDVVNVVNSTLCSKKSGKATITVKNSSGRISKSFIVTVSAWKKQKNKRGFFDKLFK